MPKFIFFNRTREKNVLNSANQKMHASHNQCIADPISQIKELEIHGKRNLSSSQNPKGFKSGIRAKKEIL